MPTNPDNFNFIREKYANASPWTLLAILILTIFLCALIGGALVVGYSALSGVDAQSAISNLNAESGVQARNFVRTTLLLNHLTMFVLPALVFSYFFYKSNWARYLNISNFPNATNLILGFLLILAAFPLAQFAMWVNMKLPLTEAMMSMEEDMAEMIKSLLIVEAPYELYFNLLVIAVIPAIGEEFIFRGIIQDKLVKYISNPHVAIWLAAFIFSAFHMQFQGLLPRMVLGAFLGYLFYWTGNLWIAIFAHFVNNGVQIVGQYLHQIGKIEIDMEDAVVEANWLLTLSSLVIVLALSYVIIKMNPRPVENTQEVLPPME